MLFHQWKRRAFITLLGGAAAWPRAARAQQANRVRRIGVLNAFSESDPETQRNVAAFRQALEKLGWTDGRNVHIDYRWGNEPAVCTENLVLIDPATESRNVTRQ